MSSIHTNSTNSVSGCGLVWSRTGAPQGRKSILADFTDFCRIDKQLQYGTTRHHVTYIKRLLLLHPAPHQLTVRDVRQYLATYLNSSKYTYANCLKALKVFLRDYLQRPELVASFKFPVFPFKPKSIPSKKDLQIFYDNLQTLKDQTLFLFYATSGLRRSEVLSLTYEDIDCQKRMIIPSNHLIESTKNSWISFYNHEAEHVLQSYLSSRDDQNKRLFPMARYKLTKLWSQTRQTTGINITPQRLREWFCIEMAELGVQDRFIDAFCGRTPKSILARHYTDYSPERLKRIYDKAGLSVFS